MKRLQNVASFVCIFSILTVLFTVNMALADFSGGGPGPGDVYKEYYFTHDRDEWRVTDPNALNPGAAAYLPNPVLSIPNVDKSGAIYAELVIDFWGGHIGTTGKKFRFNNNAWLSIPELHEIGPCPPPGNMYIQQTNHLVPVPLAHLNSGTNRFIGTSGKNHWALHWGQWGWYGAVLRVYYNSSKPHATGSITSPNNGGTFGENPTISVSASGANRVDVVAYYNGHDEDGDGNYTDFHRMYHRETWSQPIGISEHVGTDTASPFNMTWNTQWVPDQGAGSIKLRARIRNSSGYWYVTNQVGSLTLNRSNSSVRIYKATGVPQSFWSRNGIAKSCTINISTLAGATAAQLKLGSWNGKENLANYYTRINSWTTPNYGQDHFFSYDEITVPVSALRTGNNTFTINSQTVHHGIEVMWPGPSILVRYGSAPSGVPPSITQQPSDVTTQLGSTASFSVSATGTSPLSYQWRRNGNNISGATGPSYTIQSVSTSDDGDKFSCRVSNSYGNVTSGSATLTVSSSGVSPTITQHPSNVTVQEGGNATFTVSATGTIPISYQWQRNTTNISGATGRSYTISSVNSDDDGDSFRCRVSNNYGTVTSNTAMLTVTQSAPPPSGSNVLVNPGFESGTSNWGFFTNGSGNFSVGSPGHNSTSAARVTLATRGSNIQLYQGGVALAPNTNYTLSFSAYSNTGHDMKVSLVQHVAPYANYGLSHKLVNLSSGWNTYTIQFTTPAFGGPVDDGRLMFWLADFEAPGDEYWFDNMVLTSGSVTPPPSGSNVLVNPGFESGTSNWGFFTNGSGNFSVGSPGHNSTSAARVTLATRGSNIQLYQGGVALAPNTNYTLSFSAYSNTGHDMKVSLVQHVAPYANYGLSRKLVNLSSGWNTYTIQFTTPAFGGPVDDGRLMFWLADFEAPGDEYWFDNVSLSH